jgi:hypothetical protein
MTPTLQNPPNRLPCAAIWGGIEPASLDVCTQGVIASLCSTASGGQRGDIYYMSVCSHDLRTRIVVADVRGQWRPGERNKFMVIRMLAGTDGIA